MTDEEIIALWVSRFDDDVSQRVIRFAREIIAQSNAEPNKWECGKPCVPDSGCPACADYWARMRTEGLWNGSEWTERGWKEITK